MANGGISTLISIAQQQIGTHESGNNIQKYGAAFGANGLAWCAFFVCWCFKQAFGNSYTSYVAAGGTADITVRSVNKGVASYVKRAGSGCSIAPQPGDVWAISSGGYAHGHTGIVWKVNTSKKTLTTIEGNYSDKVASRTLSWNSFTDIVRPKRFQGADTSDLSIGSVSTGTSTSTTPAPKPIPYKEYFVTKPKNFKDAKDTVITAPKNISLVDSKKINTLEKDIDKCLELYPRNNELKNLKTTVSKISDYTASTLKNKYSILIQVMQGQLKPYSGEEGSVCLALTGDSTNPRYLYETTYVNDDKNYYYKKDVSWLELFNDLTLKRDALDYYLDIKGLYKSPLVSQKYLSKRRKDLDQLYNSTLASLYKSLQEYEEDKTNNFDMGNSLNDINKKINEQYIAIGTLTEEIERSYPQKNNLEKKLNQYTDTLNNMKNKQNELYSQYFSSEYAYWNRSIVLDPASLNFWIEFLSNDDKELWQYNIKNIGLRSWAVTDDTVDSVYAREVPQVIFYSDEDIEQKKTGYVYLYYPNIDTNFKNSAQGISAKLVIDDSLYQHTYCTEEISLSIIPIQYLEPNTRILVYNEQTKVNNEYIVDKISKQLAYNGTMSISATKAPERLY